MTFEEQAKFNQQQDYIKFLEKEIDIIKTDRAKYISKCHNLEQKLNSFKASKPIPTVKIPFEPIYI